MLELNKDNFETEVFESDVPVVLDFWGPQCGPCLALMPDMEKLAKEYGGKVKFCKINAAENRRVCVSLKVMGVPAFLFYKNGECKSRLVGEAATVESVRKNTDALL